MESIIDDEEIMDEEPLYDEDAIKKLKDIVNVCFDAQVFLALQARPIKKIVVWFGNKMTITLVAQDDSLHSYTTEEDMDIMDDAVDETIRSIDLTIRTAEVISPLGVYGWEITEANLDKMLRRAIWLSSNE